MSTTIQDTDHATLDVLLDRAAAAARPWGDAPPASRAGGLRAVADALDGAAEELVPLADRESHLGTGRLTGELARTTFQLRLLAREVSGGEYFHAVIDHPDQSWPPGPRPDLRRIHRPLGPVVVFAASNVPFAFSTAGGDTASALAAGCPVLLKAHPGHPALAARTGELVAAALAGAGAPEGTFAVFYGDDAGRAAVQDHRVAAGAFTGSLRGGRALFDLAVSRPTPIPFYAEMGSINPAFVTGTALADRREKILAGYVDSFTLGAGQFCTKPGLLVVPRGSGVGDDLAALVAARSGAPLLNGKILRGYQSVRSHLTAHRAVEVLAEGSQPAEGAPAPTLLRVAATDLVAHAGELLEECFGPTSMVVTYESWEEVLTLAGVIPGQLTATVHAEDGDPGVVDLLRVLQDVAGRIIWNGWPTGVSVSWAMQHGGPYPATTSPMYTSVGVSAIERFLRPVTFQSVPDALLPPALQEGNPLGVERRYGASASELDGADPRQG
jgi:NADP-dependent aldehyde dehydrogenase